MLGIAIFTMALATTSLAQSAGPAGGAPPPPATAAKHQNRLVAALEKLNLSDQQKSQINGIIANGKTDDKAFRKAHKGDLPAIKTHRKEENKVTIDAIKGVLTPEQKTQLEFALGHRRRGNKGTNVPPAKP